MLECRWHMMQWRDVLVEDEEALEHLELVLVGDGAPDLVVELVV